MSIRRAALPLVLILVFAGLAIWVARRTDTPSRHDSGPAAVVTTVVDDAVDLVGGARTSDSDRAAAAEAGPVADIAAAASEAETGTLLLTLVTDPAHGEEAQTLGVVLFLTGHGAENIECQVDSGPTRIELPIGDWHAFCRIQDLGRFEIRAGETTDVRYALEDCGLQGGTVVDEDEDPVEGVQIHFVVGHIMLEAHGGVTDAEGRFRVFMNNDIALIGIHPDGGMTRRAKSTWTKPGHKDLELVLLAGRGPNRVLVKDEEGVPLPGITVYVVDGVESRNRYTRHLEADTHLLGLTDLSGRVEFAALSARPALIVIDEPGYAVVWRDTPGDAPVDEEIVLRPSAKISGRLVRDDGMEAMGLTVQRRDGAYQDHLRTRSGEGGAFELGGLPRETVRIGVQFLNTWVHEQDFELQRGDATGLQIRLPAVELQEVLVRDESGKAIEDCTLLSTAHGTSGTSGSFFGEQGRARMVVVAGQSYDLAVSAGGGERFEIVSGATLSGATPGIHEVVVGPNPTARLWIVYEIRGDAFDEHLPPTLYLVPDDEAGKGRQIELSKRAANISTKVRRGTYEFFVGRTRETAKRIGRHEVNGDRIDLGVIDWD
tara:strand:- start:12513 stop:14315 length:1803 start_codon:yes stop_codon:yes gene_type:complete